MFYRVFVAWLVLTLKNPGVRRGGEHPRAAQPELEYINF
jgi:hypothetical protein